MDPGNTRSAAELGLWPFLLILWVGLCHHTAAAIVKEFVIQAISPSCFAYACEEDKQLVSAWHKDEWYYNQTAASVNTLVQLQESRLKRRHGKQPGR